MPITSAAVVKGKKVTPTKGKGPSFMKKQQPSQGRKKATKVSAEKKGRKEGEVEKVLQSMPEGALANEEYVNLDDELSLDTIKEIDTNQEQSRNNTHQTLMNQAPF